MKTEENKALVHRFVEDLLNKHDPAAAAEFCSPDFVGHYPGLPEVNGLAAWQQLARAYFTAFPDLEETIEDIVAEGDRVTYRVTWRGTQRGELMGMLPTGRAVSVTGMRFVRIAGGRIAEQWGVDDMLGLMHQLQAPAAAA